VDLECVSLQRICAEFYARRLTLKKYRPRARPLDVVSSGGAHKYFSMVPLSVLFGTAPMTVSTF
jgi:hypothetical protein